MAHLESEIGQLIGSNVPEALQPLEVRPSQNGGPYATRTALGWVLNGPLGRKGNKDSIANFIDANTQLNQQFESFCNMEFNDSIFDSRVSMSRNDKRALDIMNDTVKLEKGHYVIALPWKYYPPCLQNNKPLAEHRLRLLRKRLERDSKVLDKYKAFINDLLDNNYAKKVCTHDFGPLETH